MFKSALISLLLTFTFSNAQFIPASTGGFYDLRGSPTALPGLSATGIELSIFGIIFQLIIGYFIYISIGTNFFINVVILITGLVLYFLYIEVEVTYAYR